MSLLYLAQRFWFVLGWRCISAIQRSACKHALQSLWGIAVLIILGSILDPMLGHFIPRHGLAHLILTGARLWLGASVFAFLAVRSVAAVEWISRSAMCAVSPAQRQPFDPARRAFFRCATYVAGGIPFIAAAYGFGTERLRYRVERVEIPIANLPKALDGLRIVQLSDIHLGEFMPWTEVRRAVDIANDLGVDLAVVTGDFINDRHDPLEDCIAELSRLRAPLGIWGCNGNHEIYAEAEDAARELFERHGMRLLRQQSAEVPYRDGKFNLIGVDYQRGRTFSGERVPMLRGIESLVRSDIPNILLSHNPNSFYRAAELGIELSLAGHTHGGQVRFEILDHQWSPARFMTDFVAGHYQLPLGKNAASGNAGSERLASLYVNRGLGTFGVPVRLGSPPEITLLTLRSAG